MKILTIVIPTYNTEKYLKRCIDSILLKDVLDDIEILIVNDGSKDNSLNIAKEYAKRFSDTIKVIDKKNGGHGSTINIGLENAKGKYFRVLDSDDWFNSEDFIIFVEKLKKSNSDLVITNYRKEHVYDEISELLTYSTLKEGNIYKFDDFNLDILNGEYFVMATSTYKTDVLKNAKLKLIENTFYVDMIFNIIPIKSVSTFEFYNLDIYRYFIGRKDQSVNVSSLVKNQKHHDIVIKYLIEYFEKNKNDFSKNKYKYIQTIVYYMLYTHYCISLVYDNNQKNAYKQLVLFDKYLLNNSKELYDKTNNLNHIKYHRKTKFLLARFRLLKIVNNVFKKGV